MQHSTADVLRGHALRLRQWSALLARSQAEGRAGYHALA